MLDFFKQKKVFCVHNWHLIDTFTVPNGIDDEERYYVVACPKCKKEKNIPKRYYSEFEEMFNVKAPS
ncbi:hypothetical protein PP654_gp049 [Bacillus phage v_B-Bak10]|uniref:Uncharacterized protein n=2 Tax=Basiliskvirus TaxID=3044670 RepID=A0A385IK75_9CAUD|nr:hypothetical protein PP653_gp059 [Bacillus phage Basilisk]YP_010657000.1 hypothetical protein PP654_gp049 [Bacillus phage v_B-Bak10]AGR46647.1 hypothetical protein BASILISK_108 [Bacillus phage Basilisk]AXY83291.1 hypothetical protein vBBBak10_093 [Bacillus phage v_B-Bak10]